MVHIKEFNPNIPGSLGRDGDVAEGAKYSELQINYFETLPARDERIVAADECSLGL